MQATMCPTCLKKLVTVSVAGRKVAKLHMSSPTLILSKPFFFLSFHVPWPFRSSSVRKTNQTKSYWRGMCVNVSYTPLSVMLSVRTVFTYINSTGVRVGIWPIQTSHAADNVEKVNGCPGERHPKTAQTTTRLLCLQTQLLQLFLVLKQDKCRRNMMLRK